MNDSRKTSGTERRARGCESHRQVSPRVCGLAPPRSAYIHVPFCRHRCGYCNFTVLTGRDDLVGPFLRGLERELQQRNDPRAVETLFIGGGTPTRLPASAWQRLLELATEWFPLEKGGEWTVEGNPEDMVPECVAVAADAGVTRWSLGVQSFHAEKRTVLERSHDLETIDRAIDLCRAWGATVACDLIFAAPGETLPLWQADLDQALARPIDHLSTYGLTWEKGTAFWGRRRRGELEPVEEETERAMYLAARHRLLDAGWEHYEISNFARPGFRCRHNEAYWLCEPYDAVGPGAARYVDGVREVNHRSATTWLKRVLRGDSAVAEREVVDENLAARERLIFGLRRLDGIRLDQFESRTGFTVERLTGPVIADYVASGWLEQVGQTLRLTESGLLISDALWPALLG